MPVSSTIRLILVSDAFQSVTARSACESERGSIIDADDAFTHLPLSSSLYLRQLLPLPLLATPDVIRVWRDLTILDHVLPTPGSFARATLFSLAAPVLSPPFLSFSLL